MLKVLRQTIFSWGEITGVSAQVCNSKKHYKADRTYLKRLKGTKIIKRIFTARHSKIKKNNGKSFFFWSLTNKIVTKRCFHFKIFVICPGTKWHIDVIKNHINDATINWICKTSDFQPLEINYFYRQRKLMSNLHNHNTQPAEQVRKRNECMSVTITASFV